VCYQINWQAFGNTFGEIAINAVLARAISESWSTSLAAAIAALNIRTSITMPDYESKATQVFASVLSRAELAKAP
jgi:hypothetical protein